MIRFIFFSKTMLSETPRIRHQLADLLISYGHEVVFYQRPLFFFKKNKGLVKQQVTNMLEARQTKQLVHHQLRVFSWISKLNADYEVGQIKSSCSGFNESDVVINFNYDYFFLRKIFKSNKIITLINDDFVAQAKFNKGRHILKVLSKTAVISDAVLTVSYPLCNQSSFFSDNVQLFLPWSKEGFTQPVQSERNTVLLWAHIDSRVDFKLIKYVLNNNKDCFFDFVGPVSKNNLDDISELVKEFSNLSLYSSCSLNDLPLDKYFASIIPYKAGFGDIEAVTASNKTFQLLAKGLPLVTHGMPYFLEHESIYKAKSYDEFSFFIKKAHEDFYKLQPSIEELVNEQQSAQRYAQIMSIVNEESSSI